MGYVVQNLLSPIEIWVTAVASFWGDLHKYYSDDYYYTKLPLMLTLTRVLCCPKWDGMWVGFKRLGEC